MTTSHRGRCALACAALVALGACSDDDPGGQADAGTGADAAAATDAAGRACVGNVAITTPATVESASQCTSITGTLVIESTQLVEVQLPLLTAVGMGVLVNANDQLVAVEMPALESTPYMSLQANPQLASADFSALVTAGAALVVEGTQLPDMTGFGAARADDVSIGWNAQMTTIGVDVIGHRVHIMDNPVLEQLGSVSADVELRIVGNGALTTVPDGSTSNLDVLLIAFNAELSAIEGLSQLTDVGWLEIDSNPMLTDITHFDALSAVTDRLTITGNTGLSNCQAVALRDQLDTVGEVVISGNDTSMCP